LNKTLLYYGKKEENQGNIKNIKMSRICSDWYKNLVKILEEKMHVKEIFMKKHYRNPKKTKLIALI